MRWFSRKPKPITRRPPIRGRPVSPGATLVRSHRCPYGAATSTGSDGRVRTVHRLIEGQIERMLPGLEDNHGHVLDEWLATQLASAVNALHEQVARQDAIADGLIRSARIGQSVPATVIGSTPSGCIDLPHWWLNCATIWHPNGLRRRMPWCRRDYVRCARHTQPRVRPNYPTRSCSELLSSGPYVSRGSDHKDQRYWRLAA